MSPFGEMSTSDVRLRTVLQRLAAAMRSVVGAPDHDRYVAHMRRHHPDCIPMTRELFERDALRRRHERPGNRCC